VKTAQAPRPGATHSPAVTRLLTTTLATLLVACQDTQPPASPTGPSPTSPHFTMGSGTQSMLIGRATFAERFKVRRKTGDWEIAIHAKDPVDVAVQSITFQPGGQSGWHSHPGPVFIQVVSGTMTFYESDDPTCSPIVRSAGQGYLDVGEHAHIARNESGAPAKNVVTYFAPPLAALRIDEPAPGNCPF
jgi:Cupin domain